MTDKQDYITLPVAKLEPGMFVAEIVEQAGRALVNQAGIVRDRQQVALMRRHGVQVVRIDPARGRGPADAQPSTLPGQQDQAGAGSGQATDVDAGQRIRRLYEEARTLQEKLLDQIRQGESIDVGPLAAVAEEMVDTMFSHGDAMLCLARIRSKDAYLMEHSMNVAILLANFGRYLGMAREQLKELTLGGLLHDVGKVMTPDEVLHKPGKLTDEEFAIMREHATHSRFILRATDGITTGMVEIAANHHERIDGTGYPLGLKGEQLSLYSRMSAIVDVYDALTADRVYKAGMACTQAFRILMQHAGSHYDGELVQRFIKCMGVYVVGSLVRLSDQRLALVVQRNETTPLQPVVKLIYDAARAEYLSPRLLDLSRPAVRQKIECSVDPGEFGISLERFL